MHPFRSSAIIFAKNMLKAKINFRIPGTQNDFLNSASQKKKNFISEVIHVIANEPITCKRIKMLFKDPVVKSLTIWRN